MSLRRHWPLAVAVAMLGSTWLLLARLSHGEPTLTRRPLAEFPAELAGHWEGEVMTVEQRVVEKLRLSDHTMRLYQASDRRTDRSAVELYVGYYATQRTGATYHSPQNCLPGAGWQVTSVRPLAFTPPGAPAPVTVNQVLIEKGLERRVILYWYHDRGRVIASEYRAKLFLVWDALTKNRTDGALIRISTPVVSTVDAAVGEALRFVTDAWPSVSSFLPAG